MLIAYGLGVSFIIWIFYVLVVNIVLKFVFSMLAMLFAYILMFDIDIPIKCTPEFVVFLQRQVVKIMYFLGFITSVIILLTPPPDIIIDSNLILTSFILLPPFSLVRIFSAYFLTCIFPGYVICSKLISDEEIDTIEKICLTLLLSCCYSVIIGLILFLHLHVIKPANFVLGYIGSIWITCIFAEILQKIAGLRNNRQTINEHIFSLNLKYLLLLILVTFFVALSYFETIFVAPLTGLIGADPVNYAKSANRFVYFNLIYHGETGYIWSHVHILVNSLMSGLPMHYAFAGLQFLQVLLPLSFFVFARKISKNDSLSLIATMLLLFSDGVTSLLLLVNFNKLKAYIGGETFDVLWNFLFRRVGSPGAVPCIVSSSTYDIPLILIALTYAYEYLEDRKKNSKLILSSLFACSAVYFHSINFMLSFFGVLMVLFMLNYPKKRIINLILLMGFFTMVFDPLSSFFIFGHTISSRILILQSLGSQSKNFYLRGLFILLLILAISIFSNLIKKRNIATKLGLNIHRFLDRKIAKFVFWISGISFFILTVFLYFMNTESIMHIRHWSNWYVVYPWFFVVYKYHGTTLLFAIVSIPYLIRKFNRKQIDFIGSLIISFIFIAALSVAFPVILPPALIYYRYLAWLQYPLSILAALTLQSIKKKLYEYKPRKAVIITLLLLISLIPVQFLSHIYNREVWYIMGHTPQISDEVTDALEWANLNIPEGSTVLPSSPQGEILLSSFVYGVKVVPISLPQFKDKILGDSYKEVVNTLLDLNVSYVFIINYDEFVKTWKNTSALFVILNVTVLIYRNSEVRIYYLSETLLQRTSSIENKFKPLCYNKSPTLSHKTLLDSFDINGTELLQIKKRLETKAHIIRNQEDSFHYMLSRFH